MKILSETRKFEREYWFWITFVLLHGIVIAFVESHFRVGIWNNCGDLYCYLPHLLCAMLLGHIQFHNCCENHVSEYFGTLIFRFGAHHNIWAFLLLGAVCLTIFHFIRCRFNSWIMLRFADCATSLLLRSSRKYQESRKRLGITIGPSIGIELLAMLFVTAHRINNMIQLTSWYVSTLHHCIAVYSKFKEWQKYFALWTCTPLRSHYCSDRLTPLSFEISHNRWLYWIIRLIKLTECESSYCGQVIGIWLFPLLHKLDYPL